MTRETEYSLFEAHTKGLTNAEIAEATGLDVAFVSEWKAKERLPHHAKVREVLHKRNPIYQPTLLETSLSFHDAVKKLHAEGATMKSIAQQLGCRFGKVRWACKVLNLKDSQGRGRKRRISP